VLLGRRPFEVTTLRRDVSTDGRRATVAFTRDWREDALRRDFTLNALYVDQDGVISDYVEGLRDIEEGRVRFIGEAELRIREDVLRILRFYRFTLGYGANAMPDEEGRNACRALAPRLRTLSGERIAQEMLKLLAQPAAGSMIEILLQDEVWQQIAPFVPAPQMAAQRVNRLNRMLAELGERADPILALALLTRTVAADCGAQGASLAERWRLSKAGADRLARLCRFDAPGIAAGAEKDWKALLRRSGPSLFRDFALLAAAETGDARFLPAAFHLCHHWNIPRFPLNGHDLLALGFASGREIGALLERLERLWEESHYQMEREALLAQARLTKTG
jgi:tRNA nucleotidyltransferase/poly(A) polymerase